METFILFQQNTLQYDNEKIILIRFNELLNEFTLTESEK